MENFKIPNGRDSMVFYVFLVAFIIGYSALITMVLSR